ncbi:MAG: alkyl hydroperoxide reductase [Candidatus Omnitrophica bacterium CG11_big_fil_rev_8_21_14_0_20_64_10]|nr:MAG: alkyl hydroperoxide reductase [Candidatus Omnitrophica bacterium CG11_big_fil_rev_8_21_14_0_20_64_10]
MKRLGLPAVLLLLAAPAAWGELEIRPVTAEQLKQEIRAAGRLVTVVNVWATWCLPCREEFPDLVRLGKEMEGEGSAVWFVSADFDDALPRVRAFLAEQGVEGVSYIKDQRDMPFVKGLAPLWTGALPATLVFDRQGELKGFRQGQGDYEIFQKMVQEVKG